MNEDQIRAIVQDELNKYSQANMYGVSNVPIHIHNGTDSVKIPVSSVIESQPIQGSANGVFNRAVLGGQKINLEYTSGVPNTGSVNILPINIIYGFGVGVDSAFNGGDALPGTMIFFDNAGQKTLSQLWIKTENGWLGIPATLSI